MSIRQFGKDSANAGDDRDGGGQAPVVGRAHEVERNGARFIVERRGRPVAAIVSVEELERLGPEAARRPGALALIGLLRDYPEAIAAIDHAYATRSGAVGRLGPELEP